ncbi:prolactin-releasing peptide receptor-like [Salmo salar]|uniref:Prolactin-releasing peptide receptor-like n=1 Tax=Salmo salar TaxID=8030 RepID=A0A1S3LRP6_SALSA|nr:prolactin-releasing peptide receptor-like [Salmo salar]|eukprot:XP_013993536.1 PREDICTED: prolactin-releasing peptide receptor-like [Salmo salar]
MEPVLERSVGGSSNASLAVPSLNRSDPVELFSGLQLLLSYRPLFIPLYCLLVAVACVGNSLLLACILADKKLHNATNFFIGNLAAGDLLMCLSCVPLTASYAFESEGWLFGRPLCHLVPLLQTSTVFVSVLSLTAIAVDRYVVVVHPVRRRISLRGCGALAVGMWLLSLLLATPPSLHTHYVDLRPSGLELVVCEEFWPDSDHLRLLYSCFILLTSYLLPLLSVSVAYCGITARLRQRCLPGAPSHSLHRWNRTKKKTFSLLVLSVLSFAFCWLPLQVLNLLLDLDQDFLLVGKRHVNLLQVCCHLLAMSSACYNPFIYASLHSKVRLRLRDYLRPLTGRGRQSSLLSQHALQHNTNTCLSMVSEQPIRDEQEGPQTNADNSF